MLRPRERVRDSLKLMWTLNIVTSMKRYIWLSTPMFHTGWLFAKSNLKHTSKTNIHLTMMNINITDLPKKLYPHQHGHRLFYQMARLASVFSRKLRDLNSVVFPQAIDQVSGLCALWDRQKFIRWKCPHVQVRCITQSSWNSLAYCLEKNQHIKCSWVQIYQLHCARDMLT